jgi:hypothetical protein
VDRLPDDFKVHLEVPVRNGIAHLVSKRQRQLRMCSGELKVVLLDVVAGLADDLEVADRKYLL